jgi:hypothetical protein
MTGQVDRRPGQNDLGEEESAQQQSGSEFKV